MTDDRYDPPEDRVAELVAKHSPRQLAIAYLRAQYRFRQADLAFKTFADLNDAESAVRADHGDEALGSLNAALRRLKAGRTR